jgi:hypothetical protein
MRQVINCVFTGKVKLSLYLTKHFGIKWRCGQLHALAVLPPVKEPPVPSGWTPEPVWMRWQREKSPAPAVNRNLVVQPVDTKYSY